MITASHNPKEYNGFKFSYNGIHNAFGKEVLEIFEIIEKGVFATGTGTIKNIDIRDAYIDLVVNKLNFGSRKIKVVYDCGNGTSSVIADDIFKKIENYVEAIPLFNVSDGNFPNHHPDPCVENNLTQLKEKVKELNADVGISFDGDGDRLGVITNSGVFLPTDYYMIIIVRDIINKVDKKEFLYDVKCSKSLSDEIERLGGKGICYRTGNSYTKAKVREDNLPFGGELSGHVYFNERWPGFDSGLYAGLRLLEILSKTDKTVDELLEGIKRYYSTEELKFASPDDRKFKIIEKVLDYAKEKGYSFNDIDGVRVEFSDGWTLVRASNTGPNITARFEAITEQRLVEIQEEFIELIEELNK
jgi:phosphomannomutase/phosphoglucomutase